MRTTILGFLVVAALTGCGMGDPDGRGTPGPPVPLKEATFHDFDRMQGGECVWVRADRTAYVLVVQSQKEKRYKRQITPEQWGEIERLVGAHDVLSLQQELRGTGVPHETMYAINLVAQDGRKVHLSKWARDPRPRFDPLASALLGIARARDERELIYEGDYDTHWTPDGFEKR
jgi:hypothetical protein